MRSDDDQEEGATENEMRLAAHQARLDQNASEIMETMPPLWWSMYRSLQQQGFTADQAFFLLRTWIISLCPNGAKAPDK